MTRKSSIPVSRPALIGKEKEFILDCINSTWISSTGKYIEFFEKSFADYIGIKNAIACSNGTAALHLALLAISIGHGDEVIVPALTYVAVANAVTYTGAKPVFADAEPDTWNIDYHKIEPLITLKTKAIIVVHLYGHPCDMNPIMKIAKKYNLYVIEDAAEALGAEYKRKLCGSIGDISTFSFYGNKMITTGEGGMVVTNDARLAGKVRRLKGQGMDQSRRYWFPVLGYNYRMTNIQAAIGLAQMENIDKFLGKRRKISEWYNEHLKGISGITLPVEKKYAKHSCWLYSILIEKEFRKSRDKVITLLAEKGVETRPFFYPMHIMPVYRDKTNAPNLRNAEVVASKGLNLPTFYELTHDEIEYIAGLLKGYRK
jgi:perosamine synthetase